MNYKLKCILLVGADWLFTVHLTIYVQFKKVNHIGFLVHHKYKTSEDPTICEWKSDNYWKPQITVAYPIHTTQRRMK